MPILDYTAAVDKGTVTNTAGDDATIPIADATNAGLFTAAEKAKLAGLPVTVGETPPSTPADGDLWWNSSDDSGRLYVYYDEGPDGSQQWVEASPQGDTLTESDADDLYLSKVSDDTAEGEIIRFESGLGIGTQPPGWRLRDIVQSNAAYIDDNGRFVSHNSGEFLITSPIDPWYL